MSRYPGITALALAAFVFVSAGLDRADAAGGAFAVDDAAVDDVGKCKAEAWFSTSDNSPANRAAIISPNCTIGVMGHRLETSAAFARTRIDSDYGPAVTIKGKTPVPGFDFNANNKFGIAFTASAAYDLTTNRDGVFFVTIPVSIRISEPLVLLANFGHSHDRSTNTSSTTWGAAFEFNLKPLGYDKLTLIGEVFGNDRDAGRRTQLGMRFTPVSQLDIDLIYGHRLTGESANWFTASATYRF